MKKIIDIIAGTRPNLIKVHPLLISIKNSKKLNKRFEIRFIYTNQHYEKNMSDFFFSTLGIQKPNIIFKKTNKKNSFGHIFNEYNKLLEKKKSHITIVLGDVNSTSATSIAAKYHGVQLVHVESGLRSYDREMPEEINRLLTDSLSDIHFTTTTNASKNLINEGIDKNKIFFVGNIMIDTLFIFFEKIKKRNYFKKLSLKENKYLVLTIHRKSNVKNFKKIRKLLILLREQFKDYQIVFPIHHVLRSYKNRFKKFNNLIIIKPLNYIDFNSLVLNSKAIFTDSGGISEETIFLQKKCFTFRKNTERPETILSGANKLLEINKKSILQSYKIINSKINNNFNLPKLWDGKTSRRIVKILEKKFCDIQ